MGNGGQKPCGVETQQGPQKCSVCTVTVLLPFPSAHWLAALSGRVWKCEDRPKGTETVRQPGQDEYAGGLYSPP